MIDADIERTIDRIVDGGLSPAQLREATARLDATPDGWKRCALAFLEAQCWTETLREPSRPQTAATITITSPPPRFRRLGPALAAAVALAAFATGWFSGRVDRHEQQPTIAAAPSAPEPSPIAPPVEPDEPTPPAIREVARLRVATGPDAPIADVPILDGPGLDPNWLMRQPMPVSDQQQAALERQGYSLDQQRRLVAMPLADGRHVVVPVDQVQIRYVGTDPL
jgi:hypothetical protein